MEYRLKRSQDFEKVFKKGKRVFSNSLTLVFVDSDCFKVGYAVSKKHGNSVKRNRIKRLLREAFRPYLTQIKGNFFFVFIPKIKEEYSLKEFSKCIDYILKKNNFI